MKILITGSRNWTCRETIRRVLQTAVSAHGSDLVIVHGACRGADLIAGEEAEALGLKVVAVPADWDRYQKAAGAIRNQKMLDDHPDIDRVFAFHENLIKSKGTKDMMRRAMKKGLSVVRFNPMLIDVDF